MFLAVGCIIINLQPYLIFGKKLSNLNLLKISKIVAHKLIINYPSKHADKDKIRHIICYF